MQHRAANPTGRFRALVMAAATLLTLVIPRLAAAQTPTCDALQGEKRALAQALLSSQRPYECCDDAISACLKQTPTCKLATRLANDICRRAGAGQNRAAIEQAMSRRAASMKPTTAPVPIDTSNATAAGDASAPVTVVAYLCGRCPFCARHTPPLYRVVTDGALKGKVKVVVRTYPIRSHEYSTEAAMAMLAAEKLGRFWPFVLRMYTDYDKVDPSKLADLAATEGMDKAAFEQLLTDRTLRARLVESKKEGIRNKVEATPTLFINGHKYTGDLDLVALQDVLEEAHERATGNMKE